MRDKAFERYAVALRSAGIAPRRIERTVEELRAHHADLQDELIDAGMQPRRAETRAFRQLGGPQHIATAMAARPELKAWYCRWPRFASAVYMSACIAILPALPVLAGRRHAALIGRWGVCLLLSAGVTASLLLVMQLSIHLD